MPNSVGKQRGLNLASINAYRKTSQFCGTWAGWIYRGCQEIETGS